MRERQERELLSIREGLASLSHWLSVRDRDVSEISGLAARQAGDEREVQAIWSTVLSVESSVKSACERNDKTAPEVSGAKREVGRFRSLCGNWMKEISTLNKRVRTIERWREGPEAEFSNLRGGVEAERDVQEGLGWEVSGLR
jgi:hypothetical protein